MSDTLTAAAASAAAPHPDRARVRPSILTRRLLLIVAPVLAGLFAILGTAADPGAGISGPDLWKLYAENPDPLQWKSFGLHWSYTFWALPALGAWGFVRSRGAWLANIAGLFGIVGIAMLPGMLIVDFYDSAVAQVAGVDTLAEVYGVFDGMWAVDAMVLPGNISLLVSLPLAAAALWRSGLVRWWAFSAPVVGTAALFLSGFLWWGAVLFTLTAVVLAGEIVLGLRRSDRVALPAS